MGRLGVWGGGGLGVGVGGKLGDGLEDVGVADELQRRGHLMLLELLRRARRGPPVGDRRRGNENGLGVWMFQTFQTLLQHLTRRDDVHAADAGRRLQGNRPRDQRDVMSAPRRLGGDGEPHLAGGRVREEPHRVEIFARRACRDDDLHRLSVRRSGPPRPSRPRRSRVPSS